MVNTAAVKLDLEAGPALRQTVFTDGFEDNAFAVRGAGNFLWVISPGYELSENAAVFYDSYNTSFMSLTALTAKLNGSLSARASFQFNSESNPPLDRKSSDTVSRFTVVYSF